MLYTTLPYHPPSPPTLPYFLAHTDLELAEALSQSRGERRPVDMLEIISHDGTLHPVVSSDDDDDDKPFALLGPGHWVPTASSTTDTKANLRDLINWEPIIDSPPSNGSPAHAIPHDIAGFGPLYDEDEDLRRAIELSMADQIDVHGMFG